MAGVPADFRNRNFTSTSLVFCRYTKLLEGTVVSVKGQLISSGAILVDEH